MSSFVFVLLGFVVPVSPMPSVDANVESFGCCVSFKFNMFQ